MREDFIADVDGLDRDFAAASAYQRPSGETGAAVGGGVPLPAFDEVGAGAVHVGRSGPVGVEHLGAGQGHSAGEAAVEHGLGAGEHVSGDLLGVVADDHAFDQGVFHGLLGVGGQRP
ncbi:MAG TPA: hypothetical protein VK053_24200, partial [Jiangellaceae bacterium]|nr:hypothetical protein [Jiangellaceae bacterium]